MKIVLLDAVTLGEDIDLTPIERFGRLDIYERTSASKTRERIADADIVISNKVVLDRELLRSAEKLKLVCIAATGMNNVDLQAAKEYGIEVKNVAGYSTMSVAQHTFAMLFYLLEKLPYYDSYVKEGEWSRSAIFTHIGRPFHEIEGKSWGVVGLGSIGRKVADIAEAFGAKVSYYSTRGKSHCDRYERLSLEELMRESDIISIHAPLDEKTKNLIGERELKLMKEDALILNLGRGGIVDENALAKELARGRIYAALDVCSIEPLPEESPLLEPSLSSRILITPHIAWTSVEARKRLIEGIAENMEEFLSAQKRRSRQP